MTQPLVGSGLAKMLRYDPNHEEGSEAVYDIV